jgi:hypothetical protein
VIRECGPEWIAFENVEGCPETHFWIFSTVFFLERFTCGWRSESESKDSVPVQDREFISDFSKHRFGWHEIRKLCHNQEWFLRF